MSLFKEDLKAMNASVGIRTESPAYQAYQILHLAFVVAPMIAGADKFFHFLVNWDQYLSPLVTRMLPISGHTFMLGVGVIEIVAGLLVAFMPAIRSEERRVGKECRSRGWWGQ